MENNEVILSYLYIYLERYKIVGLDFLFTPYIV